MNKTNKYLSKFRRNKKTFVLSRSFLAKEVNIDSWKYEMRNFYQTDEISFLEINSIFLDENTNIYSIIRVYVVFFIVPKVNSYYIWNNFLVTILVGIFQHYSESIKRNDYHHRQVCAYIDNYTFRGKTDFFFPFTYTRLLRLYFSTIVGQQKNIGIFNFCFIQSQIILQTVLLQLHIDNLHYSSVIFN